MKGYTTVIKLIDPRQAEPLPDEALFTVHNYAHSFYEQYIEFPQLVQTKKIEKALIIQSMTRVS